MEGFATFKRIHEVWEPRNLENNVCLLKFFVGQEAFDPVCKGLPLSNLGISGKLDLFSLKRDNFMGYKASFPFPQRSLFVPKKVIFSCPSFLIFSCSNTLEGLVLLKDPNFQFVIIFSCRIEDRKMDKFPNSNLGIRLYATT